MREGIKCEVWRVEKGGIHVHLQGGEGGGKGGQGWLINPCHLRSWILKPFIHSILDPSDTRWKEERDD